MTGQMAGKGIALNVAVHARQMSRHRMPASRLVLVAKMLIDLAVVIDNNIPPLR